MVHETKSKQPQKRNQARRQGSYLKVLKFQHQHRHHIAHVPGASTTYKYTSIYNINLQDYTGEIMSAAWGYPSSNQSE